MTFDNHTLLLVNLLKEIISTANVSRKIFYLSGGFAVDVNLNHLSRNHEDTELFVSLDDMGFWKKWFEDKGYITKITSGRYDLAFVVSSNGRKYVDCHAFNINPQDFITEYDDKTGKGNPRKYKYSSIKNLYFKEIDTKIPVLSKDILIEYKRSRTREKDKLDLRNLEAL